MLQAEDPLPLRRAKITQEAALRKVGKEQKVVSISSRVDWCCGVDGFLQVAKKKEEAEATAAELEAARIEAQQKADELAAAKAAAQEKRDELAAKQEEAQANLANLEVKLEEASAELEKIKAKGGMAEGYV